MDFRQLIRLMQYKMASPSERSEMLKDKKWGGIRIGKNCEIYHDVTYGSEPYLITLGDNVRIAAGVTFITHDGGMWVLRNSGVLENADLFGRIIVGNNVFIGINAVILPGVTIGDNVIIGVGAVVSDDIPSNSVAAGIPARVIQTIEQYYEKHKQEIDFTHHMGLEEKRLYLMDKYGLSDQ